MPASGMGMPDPIPTLHTSMSLEVADITLTGPRETATRPSTKFLRDIWGNRPYIANENYERDTTIEVVEKEGGLVSFGCHFISNVGVDQPCPVEARTDWSVLIA
jgi:NADPH2 dehydrogenase